MNIIQVYKERKEKQRMSKIQNKIIESFRTSYESNFLQPFVQSSNEDYLDRHAEILGTERYPNESAVDLRYRLQNMLSASNQSSLRSLQELTVYIESIDRQKHMYRDSQRIMVRASLNNGERIGISLEINNREAYRGYLTQEITRNIAREILSRYGVRIDTEELRRQIDRMI